MMHLAITAGGLFALSNAVLTAQYSNNAQASPSTLPSHLSTLPSPLFPLHSSLSTLTSPPSPLHPHLSTLHSPLSTLPSQLKKLKT